MSICQCTYNLQNFIQSIQAMGIRAPILILGYTPPMYAENMIYLDLFLGFLKVGCFSFGGAYGAIPLIRDVVMKYGWLTEDQLTYMIAVSESTPGPIMVNLATYVGSSQAGVLGSLVATLAVVLPSFIIILIVAKCYDKFRNSKVVKGCMSGLKPAVVGLIGGAVLNVLMTVFFPAGWTGAVLPARHSISAWAFLL